MGLLELDSELILNKNGEQEAIDHICSILHCGAALRGDPTLISQLLRMASRRIAATRAERLLGMQQLGGNDLKRLINLFQEEQKENLMLTCIRGERAGWNKYLKISSLAG